MFNIKSVEDEKELGLLKEFMLKQKQFYPNFDLWIDNKCLPRIENGEYKNLIVINEGKVLGSVIYRLLDSEKVEIKNFRIDHCYERRDIGHFLNSQVEYLNPGKKLILDITVKNFSGVQFFIRNGFNI